MGFQAQRCTLKPRQAQKSMWGPLMLTVVTKTGSSGTFVVEKWARGSVWPHFLLGNLAVFPSRAFRVKGEPAAMKVDGCLEVPAVAEPIGVFFTVWILELSPSLAALVMRWSK